MPGGNLGSTGWLMQPVEAERGGGSVRPVRAHEAGGLGLVADAQLASRMRPQPAEDFPRLAGQEMLRQSRASQWSPAARARVMLCAWTSIPTKSNFFMVCLWWVGSTTLERRFGGGPALAALRGSAA